MRASTRQLRIRNVRVPANREVKGVLRWLKVMREWTKGAPPPWNPRRLRRALLSPAGGGVCGLSASPVTRPRDISDPKVSEVHGPQGHFGSESIGIVCTMLRDISDPKVSSVEILTRARAFRIHQFRDGGHFDPKITGIEGLLLTWSTDSKQPRIWCLGVQSAISRHGFETSAVSDHGFETSQETLSWDISDPKLLSGI